MPPREKRDLIGVAGLLPPDHLEEVADALARIIIGTQQINPEIQRMREVYCELESIRGSSGATTPARNAWINMSRYVRLLPLREPSTRNNPLPK